MAAAPPRADVWAPFANALTAVAGSPVIPRVETYDSAPAHCEDLDDLLSLLAGSSVSYYLIDHSKVRAVDITPITDVLGADEANRTFTVSYRRVPIEVGGITYQVGFVMQGDAKKIRQLGATKPTSGAPVLRLPADSEAFVKHELAFSEGQARIPMNTPLIVLADFKTLYYVLSSRKISNQVKTLTALYTLFHHARDMMAERVTVLSYSEMRERLLALGGKGGAEGLPESVPAASKDKDMRMAALLSFYLFGYFQTRETIVVGQAYKRYAAAHASKGMVSMALTDYEGVTAQYVPGMKEFDTYVSEAMGYVLAWGYALLPGEGPEDPGHLSDEVTWSLDHTSGRLADYKDMPGTDGSSDFARIYFDQLRLVGEYHQCTTIKFALAVLPHLEPYKPALEGPFLVEYNNLKEQEDSLKDRPFKGCVLKIPDTQRISKYPRICKIGIEYYKRCLSTEADIENWRAYNIQGIEKQIDRMEDKVTCESIASILDATIVYVVTSLVPYASTIEIDNILRSHPPSVRAKVFSILATRGVQGRWFQDEYDKLVSEKFMPLVLKAAKELEDALEDWENKERRKANQIMDGEVQLARKFAIAERKDAVQSIIVTIRKMHQMKFRVAGMEQDTRVDRLEEAYNSGFDMVATTLE